MAFLEMNIFNKGRYASHVFRKYKEIINQIMYEEQQKKIKSMKNQN